MDHIFNGTFSVDRNTVEWVAEGLYSSERHDVDANTERGAHAAGDGVFSLKQDGYIKLVDLKTNTTKNLVSVSNVKDEYGNGISFTDWSLSADMHYMLVKADKQKQWRWSSHGNY